jgi:hypothetical protein
MRVKGCDIQLQYRKTGANKRRFLVNGVERESVYDEVAQTEKIYFTDAELAQGKLTIETLD